ncbi:MAG: division/cell wall cluster transcriptional repressor MraZ [Gemmatimonadetes bacterium]|uniref:Transcriptional regulator MraZ n=1 Tax=Candidatus Kutchimonas denitrificans TaxID=3056748 RepID=A0AAE4Z677_9BACT|nr:division/cell wall cluster transcriptional repressor MraZ [Gemmatimonadota bacterium]NIR74540.1 division/cell wall cluster transcriptional repressor MraZ [Candidatus Kutchimonas denitrificans]NIS02730.1 division/cell wall cluster transcriptional repressor MraZ [Gemmatimonadota bacterium]NIT68891.1 division/cell wall cluster transcriptional repressor MraZ [Gemmatimonadota bacterium]NIU52196.1 cell division/cell wall cluster transcriptional repressor MraZ [Gemmatimonadota bacterium]
MTGFLGSYLHQLDEKGRLALPASFRRGAGGDERFVLIHAQGSALFLYPAQAWAVREQELMDLMRRQPEARPLVLSLTANAVETIPDKQGRILIPERLQKVAKLDGKVLVVGALEKIEIWNPEIFESETKEAKPELEGFVRQILV